MVQAKEHQAAVRARPQVWEHRRDRAVDLHHEATASFAPTDPALSRGVPPRSCLRGRMVQREPSTLLLRRPHAEQMLFRPLPGQPQAAVRAAGPLATRFAVCEALGIGQGQARRPAGISRQFPCKAQASTHRAHQTGSVDARTSTAPLVAVLECALGVGADAMWLIAQATVLFPCESLLRQSDFHWLWSISDYSRFREFLAPLGI